MTRPTPISMRLAHAIALAALAAASWLAAPASAAATSEPTAATAPAHAATAAAAALPAAQLFSIPVHEGGEDLAMVTHVFLPPGNGPFPVVLFSHGRPPGKDGRASLEQGVSREQLRFWLARGVAVVSPIRPGYGPSPGNDPEQSFVRRDHAGRCTGRPDFRKTADAASLTVSATLAWIKGQRWADASHVLLVGQSVGGLTSVAAAAQPLAGVVGYINFAGGSGGDPAVAPGHSCDPGQLTRMYADYGRTTTLPNLWVYASNDQYWGPDVPVAWHDAFAKGGSRTTFVHAPAVEDGDGHGLSRHARALWASYVETYIASIGFPPAAPGAASATSAPR